MPDVEIVIPVHNEEAQLAASVTHLHRFLGNHLAHVSWRILIADNASTDLTVRIAKELSARLPHVEHLHLDQKGRGRALRAAWERSRASVLAYMDVDLSTDLSALPELLAPLLNGEADIAIGTRLAPRSHTTRGMKRTLISKTYNRILKLTLHARFSDAQCGFKAVTAATAHRLLPQIQDQQWFFDTELLVLAQRGGLRIHEVPVTWVEDTDSRVRIVATAVQDLRGVARLRRRRALGRTRRRVAGPTGRPPNQLRQA